MSSSSSSSTTDSNPPKQTTNQQKEEDVVVQELQSKMDNIHLTNNNNNDQNTSINDEINNAISNKTIFGAILRGESPANFLYQDDLCVAFHDINPIAPVHFLVIPRKYIKKASNLTDEDEQIMGRIVVVGSKIARQLKLEKGYRMVINCDKHGCQSVFHLHLHVIGGRQLFWPFG